MPHNILHLIKSLGRGGAEMLLPESIKLHSSQNFSFHVIYFLPWKDQMAEAIKQAGASVHCFPANNNLQLLAQAQKVIEYCKAHKIQLIHAHLPWAGFLARYIHWKTDIPVIYTEHNKQERYHRLTYWINRLSFSSQSAAIAVSKDVEASIHNHIQTKIPITTILNGVNTEFYQKQIDFIRAQFLREQGASSWNLKGEDTLIIGTVAVFRFQKRLVEWLQVLAKARESNPNIYGIMVGAGPLEASIKAERKRLGLEPYVLMPGLQTNTRAWYQTMDVFMMTSSFEGLPIALLEAMSMALPVLATRAGGIPEVVEDGRSGYLSGVGNWKELAVLMQKLTQKETRDQIGNASRSAVMKRFSMQQMVAQLESMYSNTVKQYRND